MLSRDMIIQIGDPLEFTLKNAKSSNFLSI